MHRNHRGCFYNFFKGEIFVAKAIVLTGFLINCSRGGFFNEADLVEFSIKEKRIFYGCCFKAKPPSLSIPTTLF